MNQDILYGSSGYAIRNSQSTNIGKIEINGGTVEGVNLQSGKLIVNGGEIIGPAYGVNSTAGRVIVNGGKIIGRNGYGIYNASGIITLGEDEGDVDETKFEVVGTTYGIYNTGTFNFYDGKIKGNTAIYSSTINIPEDYEIKKKVIDGIEEAKLGVKSSIQTVAEINGIYYTTLSAAIRACENDVETTVKVTMPIEIYETINITSRQNVIIDLNGTNIIGAIENDLIKNEGTLRIIDTVGNGKIQNTVGNEIGGTGTLMLGDESGDFLPEILE